jgi:hypothetical protein
MHEGQPQLHKPWNHGREIHIKAKEIRWKPASIDRLRKIGLQ